MVQVKITPQKDSKNKTSEQEEKVKTKNWRMHQSLHMFTTQQKTNQHKIYTKWNIT